MNDGLWLHVNVSLQQWFGDVYTDDEFPPGVYVCARTMGLSGFGVCNSTCTERRTWQNIVCDICYSWHISFYGTKHDLVNSQRGRPVVLSWTQVDELGWHVLGMGDYTFSISKQTLPWASTLIWVILACSGCSDINVNGKNWIAKKKKVGHPCPSWLGLELHFRRFERILRANSDATFGIKSERKFCKSMPMFGKKI